MNEKRFQQWVRYGGAALALSLVGNLYFVLRNIELHRDAAQSDRQAQMMTVKTQIMETVLQEFSTRAGRDANIARILAQRPTAVTSQPSPVKNGGRR